MAMNILYYREGFASNSSSLHSTWHVEDASKIADSIQDLNFGWDTFICASRLGIQKYLAAQIVANIRNRIPEEALMGLIRILYPKIKPSEIKELDVDHQSIWVLPRDFYSQNSIFPSIKFIKDLEKYLVKTNAVIIGGNDNDTDDSRNAKEILGVDVRPDNLLHETIHEYSFSDDAVCVKDGEVWKLFDRYNGRKLRFSFVGSAQYKKSSTPELIDLIISNKCSHSCPYCYRGCTSEKKEAPVELVTDTIRRILYDFPVFEIAIGGGNIVEYEKLFKLCEFIREYDDSRNGIGTVFNTTINFKDFKIENLPRLIEIFNSFHGIAVSVSNNKEIDLVFDFIDANNIRVKRNSLSFQMIPELMKYDDFIEILNAHRDSNKRFGYKVTFLGFKHTGRGKSEQYSAAEFESNKEEFRKFLKHIRKELGNPHSWYMEMEFPRTFGIDTELIHNFPEIKETQASWMYTEEEGKFSCCIDLVDGYILPSSYTEYKDEYKVPEWEEQYSGLRTENDRKSKNVKKFLGKIYPKF